jgi:GNAT superfamily N-acetyltransferase
MAEQFAAFALGDLDRVPLTGIGSPCSPSCRLPAIVQSLTLDAGRRRTPQDRDHVMNQTGPHDGEAAESIDIGADRILEIRPTTAADAELICELYRPLSLDDIHRRFFRAFKPQLKWCHEWASVGERGGHGVVAIVHDGEQHAVVGEAGYAMRSDGDGDLAVTVAPEWRGWLGSYLVAFLARHAASHGIDNLQADVLLENRPMLAVLRHRGAVNLGHSDGVVRLTIGTSGALPSWPPKAQGHKVLVAAPGGRWSGEDAAEDAGCVTAVCSGPRGRQRGGCPVLEGGRCPLADAADAIVVLLDPEDEQTERLVALHRGHRPGVPIFVTHALGESGSFPADCVEVSASGDDTVAGVLSMIGPAAEPG